MRAGNVFTIEPMISEGMFSKKHTHFEQFNLVNLTFVISLHKGTWRDKQWPDNWTAVTQDGLYSAQFEQTLLVTDTGCEILTKRQTNDGNPWFLDNF